MDPFFLRLKRMTVEAKALYWQEKFIRAPLMASLAELGGVRTMFGILIYPRVTLIDRSAAAGIIVPSGRRRCLVRVRYAVKERAQQPVLCPCVAPTERGNGDDTHAYGYYFSLAHCKKIKRNYLFSSLPFSVPTASSGCSVNLFFLSSSCFFSSSSVGYCLPFSFPSA